MKRTAILAAIVAIITISAACAESLWTPTSKSITSDRKATQVGDIVTIIITETTSSTAKASTDFSKNISHDTSAGVGPLVSLIPEIGAESQQSGSSDGSTSRSSTFSAKLTARITKILPSGNLEIEGVRTVETNGEKQEVKLTGTIRPDDIATDNTIQSVYIADAKISSTGKGPVGDRQKEGFITKILKFLF